VKNKLLYFYQNLSLTINYLFIKTFNEKEFIKSNINENSVVFDVGSNVGSFIKFVSKLSNNKTLNIHSFEPNIKLIKFLQSLNLVQKHDLKVNNFAIHDKYKKIRFFENSISSQSTINNTSQIGKTIDSYLVNCISIDLYCKQNEINKIDLLKIDSEGADYNVLLSANSMLRNKKIKFIKVEIENPNNFYQIMNYLIKFNYKLMGILNQTYIYNDLKMFDCYFELSTGSSEFKI